MRDVDGSADYGVDQEVEIFDGDDTTGLTFGVQVKATAKPAKSGLYRDIRFENFEYWKSLGTPVLLVLWVESTDTLYARWVHTFDFGPNPKGEKTHRVKFTDSDALEYRVDSVRQEVEVFRVLGQGGVPRPLPVAVVVEPESVRAPIVYAFQRYVVTNGLRPYIRLVDEQPTSWVVRVLDDRLRVEHPSNAGSLSNWVASYSSIQQPKRIVEDALVTLGILIADLGSFSDAIRLFRTVGPEAMLLDEPSVASRYVEAALREDAADVINVKMLNLLQRMDDPHVAEVFDGYLFGLLEVAPFLDKDGIKALRRTAKQVIKASEGTELQRDCARLANNIAVVMKRAGAWNRVEEFLDLCAKLDPKAYAERKDVLGLRGNARWNLGDFNGAVAAYRAARQNGLSRAEVIPPLSDVLFETGKYREAADLIDEWWEEEREIDARSILRRIILGEVIEDLGLEEQDRKPILERPEGLSEGDDGAVRQLQIEFDALELGLWGLRSSDDRPLIGRSALLAFRLNLPHAWILTIMLARFGGMEEELVSVLIEGAVEAVDLVAPATEIRAFGDDDEYVAFLDELVNRALTYKQVVTTGDNLNVVDEENQVVMTLTFDEDGFLMDNDFLPEATDTNDTSKT